MEDLEWAVVEGNDDPEVFECVACGKSFKSEAAWSSHERSKKHIKSVEDLQHQMEREAADLNLPVVPSDESGLELPVEGSESPRDGSATHLANEESGKEHETSRRAQGSLDSHVRTVLVEVFSWGADETNQMPQEQKLSKRRKRRLGEVKNQPQGIEDVHVSS